MRIRIVPTRIRDDPLVPQASLLPLGSAVGQAPVDIEAPSGPAIRPFGMTRLVVLRPDRARPLLRPDYCPNRQMSVIDGDLYMARSKTKFSTQEQTVEDHQAWTDNNSDED